MSATTPTIIAGRYELQRRLAQGGMAEVWLATDLTLDRRVAVKWLKPTLATDDVVAERFRREAIAAASLNHQNIVAVHDVFEQDGRQAVVMQLIDGKSLRQLLDSQNRLSPALTCHIGACVAAALDHAHQAGFVHRDVKPGNIMITADGRVLLTDFGIAKGLDGAEVDLTHDNIMMGTAKYLSPEQVRGKKLDGRADLYSLGLVLYECLAGRVPFLGQTDADTALARLQRDPTDLSRLRATLPTGLVSIIHQLLARNPEFRPGTGADLELALRAAAEEPPPHIDPTVDTASPVGSPVGPATGRLRRAPSDYRGRARDRRRAADTAAQERPTTNVDDDAPEAAGHSPAATASPAPAIPGEPARPVADDTPSRRHRPRDDTPSRRHRPRDDTPSGPRRPRDDTPVKAMRGRPGKGLTHRRSTSLIVMGIVLVVALAVGAILWATVQYGGDDPVTSTTVLPDGATDEDTADEAGDPAAAPGVPSAAVITAVAAYDPDGDSTENDNQAADALAGDPETGWTTVCYSSRFMGGKRGVGLVVSFEEPTTAPISVGVTSAPYQLQFFGAATEAIPPTLDGWGAQLGTGFAAQDPGTVVSPAPPTAVRHVLVFLNELGPDPACTSANPYRGGLNEISVAP